MYSFVMTMLTLQLVQKMTVTLVMLVMYLAFRIHTSYSTRGSPVPSMLIRLDRKPYEPYPILGHIPCLVWRSKNDVLKWLLLLTRSNGWKTWKKYAPGVFVGHVVTDPAYAMLP